MVDCELQKIFTFHCIFVKRCVESDFLILLLYVHDILIVEQDTKKIASLKNVWSKSFAMKDLGPTKLILGMKISRDRKSKKIWVSQKRYTEKLVEKFKMQNVKPVSTSLAGHFKLNSQ